MKDEVQLDFDLLLPILKSRGWSVTGCEEIVGRRNDALGNWSIVIGQDGQVRFTATRLTSSTQRRRLQRNRLRYRLRLEAHSVLSVTTMLETVDELPSMLDQMAAFAAGRDQ